MISVKLRVLIVVAVVAGALASCWWLVRDAGPNGQLVLYGNVDIREVELAFRQSGRLAKMAYEEGAAVDAGAVMAEIDAQPFVDALAAGEAEVQAAAAELEKLRRGNRTQEIAQAEESVRQAQAVFRNAKIDFERQETLLATGSTSRQAFDAARSAHDQARAVLASARQGLDLKREGARSEDIAAAEARLAVAQAAAAQARTALADTRLVSPSRATVLSRVLEPGSMVNTATPVYSLSLRDPVYVRAYVSEPHLGLLVPGTKVAVHTDSSTKVYQGQIGFISPRAEFTPKSVETTDLRTDLVYRLRIVVSDADEGLRQGMPVTINVPRDMRGQ